MARQTWSCALDDASQRRWRGGGRWALLAFWLGMIVALGGVMPMRVWGAMGSGASEKKLGSAAVIEIPSRMREQLYAKSQLDEPGRIEYVFVSRYFWASFGSESAYRQMLVISYYAPDAEAGAYEAPPDVFNRTVMSNYENKVTLAKTSVGGGALTVVDGMYAVNTSRIPSRLYLYADPSRRLQLAWHCVNDEVDLKKGKEWIAKMASSFRVVSEPTLAFQELRERPAREAATRAGKRELARKQLTLHGYGDLRAGTPVLKNGVYVEWMDSPEPRFQAVKVLGAVRVREGAALWRYPRPAILKKPDGTQRKLGVTIGWREVWEGSWRHHNEDNDYLPFPGIQAILDQLELGERGMLFYVSETVRVEEVADERITLDGFYKELEAVQDLWRSGKLIQGEMAEAPFPILKPEGL